MLTLHRVRRQVSFIAALLCAAAVSVNTRAGECEPHWEATFGETPGIGVGGTMQGVLCMETYDHGNGETLYVGGEFERAGRLSSSPGNTTMSIATWDGAEWATIGDVNGLGGGYGSISDMAVFNGELYVGGNFDVVDGTFATAIAKWNGSTWSDVGGGFGPGFVYSMIVFDDGSGPALYVGGYFGIDHHIKKWDGSTWSTLSDDFAGSKQLRVLTIFNGSLHAAGSFLTTTGGQTVNRIARWDGTAWQPLGTGIDEASVFPGFQVRDLAVFNDGSGDALYAGGDFTTAGGITANHVAKWDGSNWSALNGGMNSPNNDNPVEALLVHNDGSGEALFAAGAFTMAGGTPINRVAKWDGASWTSPGFETNGTVVDLCTYDDGSGDALFVGGSFTSGGIGLIVERMLKWDGQTISPLGASFNNAVRDLAVFDDGSGEGSSLYACGNFITANGTALLRVARWEGGTHWTSLGGGVTSGTEVYSLEVFDDGSGNGAQLYAGGSFTVIGGNSISRVGRWDSSSWQPLGIGTNNVVRDLIVWDDGSGPALYACGQFTMAGGGSASRVARWDGTTWSPLGVGLNNTAQVMAVFDDGTGEALYVAGAFTTAGGAAAVRIAKWDGASWSNVGGGFDRLVESLHVFDDGMGGGPALYAGGDFSDAGGVLAEHIAKWNGTSWSPVGDGMNHIVAHMITFDDGGGDALYAGGAFTAAGGAPANFIAKWDGTSWSALGDGTNSTVGALTVFDDHTAGSLGPSLFVGGSFINSHAGDSHLAKWAGCATRDVPGDLTGDGVVNVFDLLDLLAAWGACPGMCPASSCPPDLTNAKGAGGDCTVDVFDLLFLLAHWG